MIVVKSPIELNNLLKRFRNHNHTIGFVPTMGALHQGHLSLIKRCKAENTLAICSIFVNPTQFNDPLDLEKYPRPIENDIILLKEAGADILFMPSSDSIYPKDYKQPYFELNGLDKLMEGAARPGHFNGVAMVIERLFHYVNPCKAYFGQKDFQQVIVINKILQQFNFKTDVVMCEIVRENNGLAMSSRNIRLSSEQRMNAGFIHECLLCLKQDITHMPLTLALEKATSSMNKYQGAKTEYLHAVDAQSLETIETISKTNKAIALVVVNYFGVRLLDNLYLN